MRWPLSGMFPGEEVFVLGDGPSLSGFDYGLLRGKNIIACNESFLRLADVGIIPAVWMFVDAKFVAQMKCSHKMKFDEDSTECIIICGEHCGLRANKRVHLFRSARSPSLIQGSLYYREHTGAAAINAAIQTGAKCIYLLGIDLNYSGDQSHSRPGHRMDGRENIGSYEKQISRYEKFASISEQIINLSAISQLKSYPKMDWREHFAEQIADI